MVRVVIQLSPWYNIGRLLIIILSMLLMATSKLPNKLYSIVITAPPPPSQFTPFLICYQKVLSLGGIISLQLNMMIRIKCDYKWRNSHSDLLLIMLSGLTYY